MHVTRKRSPILTKYTLSGYTLSTVDTATYLGVELNSRLTWDSHITKTINKANRSLGFVRRNIHTSSRTAKETAYKSLVRPVLEYCCAAWDPYYKCYIDQLEMVQRRAARYVMHRYHYTYSVNDMLHQLEWETLQVRREKIRLTLLYKTIHGLIAIPCDVLVPALEKTRKLHAFKYKHIQAGASYYSQSFFPRTVPVWNMLPGHVIEAPTLEAFKGSLLSATLPAPQ